MLRKLFKRKRVQKGELRNLDVELVSLLFDDVRPANRKGAVVKSEDGKSYANLSANAKFKSDTEGRLYVTVLEPDTLDSQGDKITKQEIVKAMDHFAEKGMLGRNDINHNMHPVDDFYTVENYILKSEDAEHFPNTAIGSWVQVLKCRDITGELWQKVQKGQFNGVSIYGSADDYSSAAKAEHTALLNELKELRKGLAKTGDTDALKVIDDRIKTLEKADDTADTREIVKAINDLAVELKKAISKSIKSEQGDESMDEEIVIKGEKIVVKEYHREIEKSFSQNGDPESMRLLPENLASQFVDETLDTIMDDTLTEITVAEMTKDNKLDVGLIDDLILVNELDGEPSAQTISASELTITPGILKGEMKLARTTVEAYKDKYGEAAYVAYVLRKLGNKALKALKKLLFKGDRDSETSTLAALDGVIALATDGSAVTSVDSTTYQTWATRIQYALKQFGEDVLEHMDNFVIYVSNKDLIDIRAEAEASKNAKGSRLVVDGAKVYFDGIQIKGRFMTQNYMIIGLPKFIIIGVRTDAEVARRFIPWFYHWYIRLRAGITYVASFVKVFKVEAGS
jgi:hypothetical protein